MRFGRQWWWSGSATAVTGLLLTVALTHFPSAAEAQAGEEPSPDPAPVKVLTIGDSLSQGFGGDLPWRYWVSKEIERQGAAVDLVGTQRGIVRGTRYERDVQFDQDHAAYTGATVDFQLGKIDDAMQATDPDVMVLMLGINDLREGDTPTRVKEQLLELLRRAWVHNPALKVVLAEIPYSARTDRAALAARLNTLLHQRFDDDDRIAFAPLAEDPDHPWVAKVHATDNVHPSAAGHTLIADAVATGLAEFGLIEASDLYQPRRWRPDFSFDVGLEPGRLLLSWQDAQAIYAKRVRAKVRNLETGKILRSEFFQVDHAALDLPRGTYKVRLVPRRGRMIGMASRSVVTVEIRSPRPRAAGQQSD